MGSRMAEYLSGHDVLHRYDHAQLSLTRTVGDGIVVEGTLSNEQPGSPS